MEGGGLRQPKVVRYEFLRPFLNVKNLKKFQGTPPPPLGLDFVLVPLYSFYGEIVILLLFLKPQHNTSNIIREVRYDILFSKKMLFPPLILHTPPFLPPEQVMGLPCPTSTTAASLSVLEYIQWRRVG